MNASATRASRVVSSDAEELILVDADDNQTGFLSKGDCHDGEGILHRAFSVFLFDDEGRVLLQKRAAGKRLWPGYWSNSCCSHPRRGESLGIATSRRLADELNIEAELEHVYRFAYQATFGSAGAEHELCHVFLGRVPGEVRANVHEIEEIRYLNADSLEREFERAPGHFTPWFLMEWNTLRSDHAGALEKYLGAGQRA